MNNPLEIDAKSLTISGMQGIKEQESYYGPVFPKFVARYTTEFVAKRIGDPSPPSIDNLDDCTNYLIQNIDKYPHTFAAIAYGVAKTQKIIEVGAGARTATKEVIKKVAEKSGVAEIFGKIENLTEAWKTFDDFLTMAKMKTADLEITGDQNCATAKFKECHVSDECKAIVQEGIHQVGGNLECFGAKGIAATLEVITGSILDYEIVNFAPPKCNIQVFKT